MKGFANGVFAGMIIALLTVYAASCAPQSPETAATSTTMVQPREVAKFVYEYRFEDGVRCYQVGSSASCVVVK